MALTLIHGSNGGYKSSRAIEDFVVPAMETGKIVVTNIRGVELSRFYDNGIRVHDISDVIYIDTENTPKGKLGRELLSCFWHWAPTNALLVFDESGVMFPKAWRDADLKKLDGKFLELKDGGVFDEFEIEITELEGGRPDSFIEAFEMHRHYGWDILLIAPNIKSIRDDIRNTSELAWRHRNAALVGMKGRYKAVSHDASNNGLTIANVNDTKFSKISPRTFKLYDSTKTGTATDTANASKGIFGSAKLYFIVALTAVCFVFAFSSGGLTSLTAKTDEKANGDSVEESNQKGTSAVRLPVRGKSYGGQFDVVIYGEPIAKIHIAGNVGTDFSFTAQGVDGEEYDIDLNQLAESGYFIVKKSGCHVVLIADEGAKSIYCRLTKTMSDEEYADYLEQPVQYEPNFVEGQI